jgi:hypothetical protein
MTWSALGVVSSVLGVGSDIVRGRKSKRERKKKKKEKEG